jgi:hypothetical protein
MDEKELVLDEDIEKEPSLELFYLQTRCPVKQDHKFLLFKPPLVGPVLSPW